jgi:hypothetical protein
MHISSSCCSSEGDDEKAAEHWANMFGPGHVDQTIRQSINLCWMALPNNRKTSEAVDQEIRRLYERALKDFREDSVAFGKKSS